MLISLIFRANFLSEIKSISANASNNIWSHALSIFSGLFWFMAIGILTIEDCWLNYLHWYPVNNREIDSLMNKYRPENTWSETAIIKTGKLEKMLKVFTKSVSYIFYIRLSTNDSHPEKERLTWAENPVKNPYHSWQKVKAKFL